MQTPDITPAQVGAFATGALGLAATFGFHLSQAHGVEVMSLTGVMAVALMYVDKEIRKGRAMVLAAHNGGYSFKTALEDALIGATPPAPVVNVAVAVPPAPPVAADMTAALDAAGPVIVDPVTMGQTPDPPAPVQ